MCTMVFLMVTLVLLVLVVLVVLVLGYVCVCVEILLSDSLA